MSWTPECEEQLRNLWSQGMNASAIAKTLGGLTRNAVIGKVHRLGMVSNSAARGSLAARNPQPLTRDDKGPEEGTLDFVARAKRQQALVDLNAAATLIEVKDLLARWIDQGALRF